ncbi:MAG: hypothetical protein EXS69_00090 [Candidatus Zambryskibacteria bacterium]|nr:hypothetical protein [Candidatus Zambryskibacteria bacterium]
MTGLKELIQAFGGIISTGTVILAGAGLLIFLWGLVKFIFKIGGSEKAVEEGRNIMVWGLIALFVMTSVWGIILFFQNELNLPDAKRGILPSRNPLIQPGNQPKPGILPTRGNFPWPGNVLQRGNIPLEPSRPWYYFGISF